MWACQCGLIRDESEQDPQDDYCPRCNRAIVNGRFFDVEDLDKVKLPVDIKEKFAEFVRKQENLPQEIIQVVNEYFWDLLTNEDKQER